MKTIEHNGVKLPGAPSASRRGRGDTSGRRGASSFFDANRRHYETERILKNEEGVLRFHTLRKTTNSLRALNWRNPYRFKDNRHRDETGPFQVL